MWTAFLQVDTVCECDVAIMKKIDRLARSKIIESKESAAAVPPAANHVQARPDTSLGPSALSLAHMRGALAACCCLCCASNVLAAAASSLVYHSKNSTTLAGMASTDRPRTFLDIDIAGEPAGRLVFELFSEKTPKTCEKYGINWRAMRQNRDADWSHAVFGNCARLNTMAFLMLHLPSTESSRNS